MEELKPQDLEDLLKELHEEEAETELRAEEASSPPSDEAAHRLEQAFALEDESEYEKALEECDAAIRLDPALADAHNLRGVILEELGREAEAILAYREALRLDPGFDAPRENLQAVETELQAEETKRADLREDRAIRWEEMTEEWVEEQVLFEAENQMSRYTWQAARVRLEQAAGAITIYGLPDGRPIVTVPVNEISSFEIVERGEIRYLSPRLENTLSRGEPDAGCFVLPIYLVVHLIEGVNARATKVPALRLLQSPSDDSGDGWVIHLRSKARGHEGRVPTLEMVHRIVAFLHKTGYEGTIPEELSVPVDLTAVPAEAVAEPAQATEPTDPKASLQSTSDTRRSGVTALLVSVLLSLPVICCASSLWILGGAAGNDQELYSMGDSLYKLGYPLTMIVIKLPDYAGRYLTTKDDLWAIPLVSLLFVVQWVIWGQLIVAGIRRLRARHD